MVRLEGLLSIEFCSLKIHMLKPYPWCVSIWRWSLWAAIRFRWSCEVGTLMTGLSTLVRRETRELALLLHVHITRKGCGSIQPISHLQIRESLPGSNCAVSTEKMHNPRAESYILFSRHSYFKRGDSLSDKCRGNCSEEEGAGWGTGRIYRSFYNNTR